jgi:CRISPR-associated protein Cas5d
VSRPRYPHPPLTVEVSGPYACFTRPELKTERVSYPVMTPSAAKGVLEAIYWKPEFDYVVTTIEVLREIKWASVRRNEVTSMITLDWVRKAMADATLRYDVEADRDQRNTVFLTDVAYRIRAQISLRPHADKPEAAYRDQFRRRVERGACFSQPFLGTRECSAASFGAETVAKTIGLTDDLGVMLHSIRYGGQGETYTWFPARLDNGIMAVPAHGIELADAVTQPGRGA